MKTLLKLGLVLFVLTMPVSMLCEAKAQDNSVPKGLENLSIQAKNEVAEEEKYPELVSFDFKDADIKNVLRIFSHKIGVNIIAGKEVSGSITIRLNNVHWEKALELILDVSGFAYVRDGNIIKVLPATQVANENLKTEVFVIDYASAAQIKGSIDRIITERGSIQTDVRSNALIITDTPSNLYNIKRVIERLDAQTPQVLITAKIIETNMEKAKKLGIKWSSLSEYTVSIRDPQAALTNTFTSNRSGVNTESYLRTDGLQPSDEYGSTYTRTDSMSPSGNIGFGMATVQTDKFIKDTLDVDEVVTNTQAFSNVQTAILSADTFSMVLSALESADNTDIISAPQIITTDNREAFILVGEQYPIANFAYNDETGTYEATGFEYKDIGITLTVTPHINSDGYITLDVHPEISENVQSAVFASLGTSVPIISTQKVDTQVVIKDNETVAIGGLIKEKDIKDNTKVPFLGSLPIIGNAFRSKETSKEKRNLLIFITANIVNDKNFKQITEEKEKEFEAYQQNNLDEVVLFTTEAEVLKDFFGGDETAE